MIMENKNEIMSRVNQLLQLMSLLKKQEGADDIRPEVKQRNRYICEYYKKELVRLLNKIKN